MPSLRLLGRRLNLSSDDLPIPGALLLAFHLAWCGGIASTFKSVLEPRTDNCDNGWLYGAFAIVLLACFLTACVIELFCIVEGTRGSLFEDEKRARMPKLLAALVFVSIVTAGVNVWGTWLLYGVNGVCKGTPLEWRPGRTFEALVWTTWVVLLLFLAAVVIPLQLFPSERANYDSWQCRWTCIAFFCCCRRQITTAPEGEQRPLERISDLFYKFFRHADFTSSDVAVTLYLASLMQRLDRRDAIRRLLAARDHVAGLREPDEAVPVLPADPDAPALAGPPVARLLTASHMAADLAPGVPAADVARAYCQPGGAVSHDEMRAAANYAHFAMAAYGTLYFLYARPPAAIAELCWGGLCPCGFQRARRRSGADPAFPDVAPPEGLVWDVRKLNPVTVMNKSAICGIAGIAQADLRHVNSANKFNEKAPYYIALDRRNRAVVLSIRGTLSLDDTLTDLMCHPEEFAVWTAGLSPHQHHFQSRKSAGPRAGGEYMPGPGAAGHSGVMRLAAAIIHDLGKTHALFDLLGIDVAGDLPGSQPEDVLLKRRKDEAAARALGKQDSSDSMAPLLHERAESGCFGQSGSCHGWKLVITGHSLGAGIAVFVGLHLHRMYHSVEVWSYSPPGWLLTPELAEYTREFVTSVVINKDLVPRLTLKSLEKLRDDLVAAGVRCRYNKPRVVMGSFWYGCCTRRVGVRRSWGKLAQMFAPQLEEATPGARSFLEQYKASLAQHVSDAEFAKLKTFGLPGRVLFIRCCKTQRAQQLEDKTYTAMWIDAADIQAEGLLLSKHMLLDHLPDRTLAVVDKVFRSMEASVLGEPLAPHPPTRLSLDGCRPEGPAQGLKGGALSVESPGKGPCAAVAESCMSAGGRGPAAQAGHTDVRSRRLGSVVSLKPAGT